MSRAGTGQAHILRVSARQLAYPTSQIQLLNFCQAMKKLLLLALLLAAAHSQAQCPEGSWLKSGKFVPTGPIAVDAAQNAYVGGYGELVNYSAAGALQ